MYFFNFSSMSSGFNAMAATTLRDVVMPMYQYVTGKVMSDKRSTLIAKILGIYSGLLAFVSEKLRPMGIRQRC